MTSNANSNQALNDRRSLASLLVPMLLLFAALCGLTFVTAGSPPLPNLVCAQDLGFIVDAGYRFYQGQIAHLDYRSPLGPVLGAFVGLPLLLFGANYESFKFVPIAATWIFSIWTLALTWRLIGPTLACLLSFAVGLYGGGLFHLGFPPEALTFAVFYNRLGFALLTLGMISLIQRGGGVSPGVSCYLSFGIAAALLFFLKINFAFFLAVAAGLQVVLGTFSRSQTLRFALAAVGCVAVAGLSINFRFDLMFDDLARAAAARSTIANELFFPLRNFHTNLDTALLVGVLVAVGAPALRSRFSIVSSEFARWAVQCAVPFLIGYGITLMQSHGDGRLVLPGLVGFVFAVAAYAGAKGSAGDGDCAKARVAKSLLCASCIIIIVPHLFSYSTLYKCRAISGAAAFNAASLKGLIVGGFNSWGEAFVPRINEATDLVERHVPKDSTVEYVDMGNIITFGTGRPSSEGAAYVWDKTSTIALDRPLADSTFDNVEFLLLPKGISVQGQEAFYQLYGNLIERKYRLLEETQNFGLFKRLD